MKKNIISLFCCMFLATIGFAQSADISTSASVGLRAHTTAGFDFNTNTPGIETSIDQLQIWFEFIPYDTYGTTHSQKNKISSSLRVEGFKLAIKDFERFKEPDNADYSEQVFYSEFEKIIAEVTYNQFFMEIASIDPDGTNHMWFSDASLYSIFDGVIDTDSNNLLGFPFTSLSEDLVQTTTVSLGLTGQLVGGMRTDKLDILARVGTPGVWNEQAAANYGQTVNENKAIAFGTTIEARPITDLSIKIDGLQTLNYDFGAYLDLTNFGVKTQYNYAFTDMIGIKPYLGFDGIYKISSTTNAKELSYEVGGGVYFYWRGADYVDSYDVLNIWGEEIPVGASLAFNVDNNQSMNLVFSAFDTTDEGGLVPNLGGFLQLEAKNLTASNNKDSRFGVAGQTEYKINSLLKPYLFGKYVQGYKSNKLTKTNDLNSRIGIVLYPSSMFTVDFRYERNDKLGENKELDNGAVSCRFAMKL